ncbi:MAG: PilW family protein [Gammaproteobacteria bacterium]|nr:PilW family protein [Gammaproteobacteria bacterium]
MIAMTVSLVLLAGVGQIYVSSKQTYRVQDGVSRVQENGRFAIQFLSNDLRMADFWGCVANATEISNDVIGGGGIDIGLGGISGTDNDGYNGSDTLVLQGAYGSGIVVEPPFMNTNAAALHVSTQNGLARGDIVMVSDCQSGDVFQITDNNPNTSGTAAHNSGGAVAPGNSTGNLSKTYAGDAQIYKVRSVSYALGAGSNNGEPALFRNNGVTNLELADGVENMQIEYGEDTDTEGSAGYGTANYYVPLPNVTDMERVVSIRISLLMRTYADNLAPETQTYAYNGANITAGDRRIRQVYTTTIAIRNRTP